MKLLVSVTNISEAGKCVKAGTDIVDIKNPKEGSLGGHSPSLIRRIRCVVPRDLKYSAVIGDIVNKPGLVSQAAAGIAACNVDYIKFGLCDAFTVKDAIFLVKEVVKAVREVRNKIRIVVCGYADAKLNKLILPEHIPCIVYKAGADVAMIDTFIKGNGLGLFDYLKEQQIDDFCLNSHKYGLRVALAGSLKEKDILKIKNKGLCDIIGIRGLACNGKDRNRGIEISRIKAIKKLIGS